MKRELSVLFIIAACILAAFIASVVISEAVNLRELKQNYPVKVQGTEGKSIEIPAPSKIEMNYQKNKVAVWIINLLLSMIVPLLFLFSGLSAGIRKWAEGKSRNLIIAAALFFIVYSIINYLIDLPFDFYAGFIRKHSYGLSNQTLLKWITDSLKAFGLNAVFGAAIIWIPYLIIRRSPDKWWLYLGLLTIPLLAFISYVSPVFIDPLFNKYEPMKDKALETQIYRQLDKTIIKDCKVYQIDKSVDTKEMNAYMTGVLNTKRIVLWDTTMNKLNNKEVLGVVAHEMGHYLMGHVWKSIVLGGLACIIGLFFVNRWALWILDKSGGAFGIRKISDLAALPLLLLLLNIFMFIIAPASSAYSRYNEREADRFELELAKDNYSFFTAMIKLHEGSLSLPKPGLVYKLWNYDHPTLQERVDFANSYRPWEQKKPLKYEKYLVSRLD